MKEKIFITDNEIKNDYIESYEKKWYDVYTIDGLVYRYCWPNAGKFNNAHKWNYKFGVVEYILAKHIKYYILSDGDPCGIMVNCKDLPKLKNDINIIPKYDMHINWLIRNWIPDRIDDSHLNLMPDFHRGIVWNELQQIKFIEYWLMGGKFNIELFFNCPKWNEGVSPIKENSMVLVDGLQRYTALSNFVNNRFRVFDHYYYRNIELGSSPYIKIFVNNLDNYIDVIKWYIELNDTGIKHTKNDIDHTRSILSKYEGEKGHES